MPVAASKPDADQGLYTAIGEWHGSDRPCHQVVEEEYITAAKCTVVCVRGRWCVRVGIDSRLVAADLQKQKQKQYVTTLRLRRRSGKRHGRHRGDLLRPPQPPQPRTQPPPRSCSSLAAVLLPLRPRSCSSSPSWVTC